MNRDNRAKAHKPVELTPELQQANRRLAGLLLVFMGLAYEGFWAARTTFSPDPATTARSVFTAISDSCYPFAPNQRNVEITARLWGCPFMITGSPGVYLGSQLRAPKNPAP